MSDSDSDYVDIGEDEEAEALEDEADYEAERNSEKRGRGKDIDWIEIAHFEDKAVYENSAFFLDIEKHFTLRKARESCYSDNDHFTCKYSRKRGFLPCPLQYKVHFLTTSQEVKVESNAHSHVHEEDPTYTTDGPNFRWTGEQTEIVMNGVRSEASTKVIRRNLKDANVFSEGNFPTPTQLTTKIQYCRDIVQKTIEILDTHQLRQHIAEKLQVPVDETESYIAYHHVDDEDDSLDPHFSIIWTSKKLLARINEDLTMDDATYRLTWQRFPFFVSGRSTPTGIFFPTHVTLASQEDTRAWATSYKFVREILIPRYRMADGAKEISKAGVEVFGDEGIRLMCWPHTYRNVVKNMRALHNINKKLEQKLISDIKTLQWSVHSEQMFIVAFDLLETKYKTGEHSIQEKILLDTFFEYFRTQWGPESHVFRWYEGANPWAVSNNQGIEGINKSIKKDHTFKRRCPLGTLMVIVDRMLREWGEVDDILLFSPRMEMLFKHKSGLKLRTEGYQWMKLNKIRTTDKIIEVNPRGKYTVAESSEFKLGKVDKIWVVESSDNSIKNSSLKKLAKQRIKLRAEPEFESFDEYVAIRTSSWIIEERDGQFFCDCPIGMKGKLCKHTVGMAYKHGHLEITSEVRAVPLGQKRKRGRPKALGNCLMRSPPQTQSSLPAVITSSPTAVNSSLESLDSDDCPDEVTPARTSLTSDSVPELIVTPSTPPPVTEVSSLDDIYLTPFQPEASSQIGGKRKSKPKKVSKAKEIVEETVPIAGEKRKPKQTKSSKTPLESGASPQFAPAMRKSRLKKTTADETETGVEAITNKKVSKTAPKKKPAKKTPVPSNKSKRTVISTPVKRMATSPIQKKSLRKLRPRI